MRRVLRDGVERVKSYVQLVDEVHFELLDKHALKSDEIVESVIRAEVSDGADGVAERFVVGTGYLDEDRSDSIRGRILVFEVNEERKLVVESELGIRGACRCLGTLDGKIVAALIKTVGHLGITLHRSTLTGADCGVRVRPERGQGEPGQAGQLQDGDGAH